ncbi:aspartyl/glutamyl-tRNA(Asn/Gln) amidotransferase subunit A [Desulfonatronum thiosulfatophilum]|uniref:Glutamyl-tRNA(Gln) amidotransferase subunit A n=1 Tax=Desulfonatronum thiosulfatophilum TaxID=617002 RepID=A0A1G6CBI1_9BACT|nr:Asp-tRNA(Asn)/Glu-tRNA(Gln) amidotransferase subunit GatA [Desulfonatronum thiosulfatophilum]SDB30257.1 aspartyl/glutamyl-tRNA(Asn/Gln) amidotransferase subunit A [Desulfonatronum thiosulfatophilum]
MSEFHLHSMAAIRRQLAAGEVRVEDVVRSCLDRMDALEPSIRAFVTRADEQALNQAREMDRVGPGADSPATKPLWGVPLVIKDVLTTRGIRTTCGSKMLDNFTPCFDAEAVTRLRDAGAVILGKVNMDEFAMGSSTENSAYNTTANPWKLDAVPGGSSGGSAAAVAARMGFAALGTDTGGSIRQPAAFCGVVGLKPSYGRVSRYGLVAYASSLDQIGPMTLSVEDAALLLRVIAGHDPKDSTSADRPVPDYPALLAERADLAGLRIGMPEEFWGEDGLEPDVAEGCRQATALAEELGATCVPISLPHTPYAVAAYYVVATAEASSNLARFDGVRYGFRDKDAQDLIEMYRNSRSKGFGEEVQRRIMLGTYVLSSGYYDAYYKKAAQVRRLIQQDFLAAFERCDVICGPVTPTTAFGMGEKTSDPLQMYLTDIFTISLNLAGLPGLSLPVGLGKRSGLPVGMQIFGPAFREDLLLQVGHVLERRLPRLPLPTGVSALIR